MSQHSCPGCRDTSHDAPERTRTSTDHTVHKALNQIQPASMSPGASRTSSLRGLLDALDGFDEVDVLKVFSGAGRSYCPPD